MNRLFKHFVPKKKQQTCRHSSNGARVAAPSKRTACVPSISLWGPSQGKIEEVNLLASLSPARQPLAIHLVTHRRACARAELASSGRPCQLSQGAQWENWPSRSLGVPSLLSSQLDRIVDCGDVPRNLRWRGNSPSPPLDEESPVGVARVLSSLALRAPSGAQLIIPLGG